MHQRLLLRSVVKTPQPSMFLLVSRITVLSSLQTLKELKQALRDLSKGDLNNIPADYREGPWFALFFRKLKFTDLVLTLHSFAHSAFAVHKAQMPSKQLHTVRSARMIWQC